MTRRPDRPRRAATRVLVAALSFGLATLACTPAANPVRPQATKKPATPKPAGSGKPTAGPSAAVPTPGPDLVAAAVAGKTLRKLPPDTAFVGKVRLTGTLSLLTAGIISDNGGGIISDNGGGVVSNNGGQFVGKVRDPGAGIISDNGGGFVGKVRYGLRQAAGTKSEAKLADAVVLVEDAQGRVLADADGKPIAAVSDGQGGYVLDAQLPREALVLRAPLWSGGRLSAMVARDALEAGAAAGGAVPLDLGTSSSIGAAYVLGEFVASQADPQATLNKLPAGEAARLTRDLEAARKGIAKGPTYQDGELRLLGGTLRGQDATVDQTLADIRALLIGQANLGGGRPATDVPLFDVWALAVDAGGTAYVGEHALGRLRAIRPDGTIETVMDAVFGRVRENVPGLTGIVAAPDGLFVAGWTLPQVLKVGDAAVAVAGTEELARGGVDMAATATAIVPQALARAADGTLYVGEGNLSRAEGGDDAPPRVLKVEPGGTLRKLPVGAGWGPGRVTGLALAADGTLWGLYLGKAEGTAALWKLAPGAAAETTVASGLATELKSGLALGPDGKLYVCEGLAGRVVAIAPDGTKTAVSGPAGMQNPSAAAFGPDGALWLADVGTTLVQRRAADGTWAVKGGTTKVVQQGAAGALALNFPGAVAWDAQGRLLISEAGGHKLKRLDGDALTTFAGSAAGFAGDGGPASAARFDTPIGLRRQGDALWVMDQVNQRLRKIDATGTIQTMVGGDSAAKPNLNAKARPAAEVAIRWGSGLAMDAQGQPYWASQFSNQVARLRADGKVELVAGLSRAKTGIPSPTSWLEPFTADGPAAETTFAMPGGIAFDPTAAAPTLYVADLGHMRIVKITDLDGAPQITTVAGVLPTTALPRSREAVVAEQGIQARDAAVIAPSGLCFDAAGNLYVGELGIRDLPRLAATFGRTFPKVDGLVSHVARVRKIAKDGTITTVAGPGGKFFADPTAEDALVLPLDLGIDPQGRLVIVDAGANLIRVLPAGSF